MATTAWKTLGQQDPTAATLTTLYTVPAGTQVVAKCFVANRSATATSFRLAVRPDGASIANAHYVAYDVAIPGNTTIEVPGLAMDATDVVSCYATLATLSFNLHGQEIS